MEKEVNINSKGKITVIVLDGEECSQVMTIDKEEIGKAIATGLPITIVSKDSQPSKVGKALSSVGEGISDTGKAAVIGVSKLGRGIGSFFGSIKEGIHDAACEFDKRKAEKEQEKANRTKEKEETHCE